MELTNETFNKLMSLRKKFDTSPAGLSFSKKKHQLGVTSIDGEEEFIIDVDRSGTIEMKSKVQNRYSSNQVLIRLEINAPPHTNPDCTATSRDHIHIYKEGYDLSWAYDLEGFREGLFEDLKTFDRAFVDFCCFCNIELDGELQAML